MLCLAGALSGSCIPLTATGHTLLGDSQTHSTHSNRARTPRGLNHTLHGLSHTARPCRASRQLGQKGGRLYIRAHWDQAKHSLCCAPHKAAAPPLLCRIPGAQMRRALASVKSPNTQKHAHHAMHLLSCMRYLGAQVRSQAAAHAQLVQCVLHAQLFLLGHTHP